MTHITGHDRCQMLLLPEAVDDYVAADNPVRFIDAFVEGLDLAAAGFARVVPEATGRPGYAPGDLLKLGRLSERIVDASGHLNFGRSRNCKGRPPTGFPNVMSGGSVGTKFLHPDSAQ